MGNLNVNYPDLVRKMLKMYSIFDFNLFQNSENFKDYTEAGEGF